jgi:NAD(P)-dependent dehydrogenase (short-subunit alcohol dehydrogenase family)
MSLAQRVALVTGASQGIGRICALRLAKEGAAVALAARNQEKLNELVHEIEGAGGKAAAFALDVADEEQVKSGIKAAIAQFGKIDILVNNAAVYSTLEEQDFTAIDTAVWDRVMAVNVRGPFLMAKYVVPHMRARRYGKIINIGSGTVFRGIPQLVHYVTSKGAVSTFTRSLSRAVGTDGICVNTLAPGFTLSDSVVENNPTHVKSSRDNAIQRRAIKRDAYPPDLIGALIFLASPDSDFITGQTIAVDGGAVNT